jgi:phosphoglycolate phosphatase-like HAD superfamily hydrolase
MSLHDHATLRAVLFDADDIVAHEEDEATIARPAAGAERAVAALRRAGLRIGVVADRASGQSATGAADAAIDALFGPIDVWCECREHTADAHRDAVLDAATVLGVDSSEIVVIGGTGADVSGARDAGAASVLVGDAAALVPDVEAADVVVDTVADAAALVLHSARH